jgi:radical SAM protein with 4Fe4S-binding SPASM domain
MSKVVHRKDIQRNALMYLSRKFNRSLTVPDRVSVNLTLRCNLHCIMCTTCYQAPELSLQEIYSIIDQTADMGVEVFNPLGGEPFMRGDIEDILSYAVQKGFFVSLTTNGTLISQRRAERIAQIPVDRLHFNFSLDGNKNSNDYVRGEGNYERAIQGYLRMREADEQHANSRRKILTNTILHAKNIYEFEGILEEQSRLGFDGVQILNLFRSEDLQGQKESDQKLWFEEKDYLELENLCERLAQRVERNDMSGYRIQNSAQELRNIPNYYREKLSPLEAPCWAGWKELYINSDGQAIMCDGGLDFLNGGFGNVRTSSLRELWTSETLRTRRSVVKKCTTPCIQNCYLRQDSDSLLEISHKTLRYSIPKIQSKLTALTPFLPRFNRARNYQNTNIRLELSDVSHCDSEHENTSKWNQLISNCSEIPNANSWHRMQTRGDISFDRGFMGFEVIQKLIQELTIQQCTFAKIILGWRGEPLLHPEFERIFLFLVKQCQKGMFASIRIETSPAFISERKAQLASLPVRQEWLIDLDKTLDGSNFGIEFVEAYRSVKCHVILKRTARVGWNASQDILKFPNYSTFFGEPPPEHFRNALWFSQWFGDTFWEDQKGEKELQNIAKQVGVNLGKKDREIVPRQTMIVSWDGKVTVCIRDVQLQHAVGEINHHSFMGIFAEQQKRYANQRKTTGDRLQKFCSDCGLPWNTNH